MAELTGQYHEGEAADDMFDRMHEALSLVGTPISYGGRDLQPTAIQTALAQLRVSETAPLEDIDPSASAYYEPGYARIENNEYCGWLLSHLEDRDREVIERRYGFRTGYPQVMSTIADALGVSQPRVHQLHERALEKLRKIALSDYSDTDK